MKQTLLELLKKNRPNLSTSSMKTYISAINTISNGIKTELTEPEHIIEHYKHILEYLEQFKPNVRKTRIAAIVSIIDDKNKEHSEKLDKVLDELKSQMYKDAEIIKKNDRDQKLSESQESNYITWKEVLDIYKNLKEKALPLMKLKRLNDKQFFLIQHFILLSLYVLIKPRRSADYVYFKLRNINEDTDNFMYKTGKTRNIQHHFVFNNYKNSKRLGQQIVDIPKELSTLIENWSKINTSDYLLSTSEQKPITQTRITKMLNNIFGKKISTSMLRHIYLTSEFGDVDLEKLEQATREMGNSQINRTLAYVSKKNNQSKKDEDEDEDDDEFIIYESD